MATYSDDTIRILVSTDNHVGFGEGEEARANDSWRTFDEVLSIARANDVDMVLLAGDLFHENHPSRTALIEVMKSLRKHCLGDKPCAVEIIGDQTQNFDSYFSHANYLDHNINVSIPVFSIHGNHDDPTGVDHTAALDVLHTAGLINYYGGNLVSDKIDVKPILMQKGSTKLALYGIGNVRDERLFQTFRNHDVTFFEPTQSKTEWFNILSVHQNHTPHTDNSYLPETSLPDNMDLIIWGHEHECSINPRLNPEMGFRVMQPGSTIATSLIPGEAIPKQVAILNIDGKDCKVETIRLKTVRPFIYRDVVLKEEKALAKVAHKADNLTEVKGFCKKIIAGMIEQAKQDWSDENGGSQDIPLPLVRLRVEYTAPEGGDFKVESNVRFSKEYQGLVANDNDVVQFHRRRATTRKAGTRIVEPDVEVLQALPAEVKVADLVNEYLNPQSLTMLPQNQFGDAVNQFVAKGDKRAMDLFIDDVLKLNVASFEQVDESEEEDSDGEDIRNKMNAIKAQQEDRFAKGEIKARQSTSNQLLPRPLDWNSDEEGISWVDFPGARAGIDENAQEMEDEASEDIDTTNESSVVGRGRGRGRARGNRGGRGGRAAATAATTTKKPTAVAKKSAARKPAAKGRSKKAIEEESEEADSDVMMLDDDDDDDDDHDNDEEDEGNGLFVSQASVAPRTTTSRTAKASVKPTSMRQSTLSGFNAVSSGRAAARTKAAARRESFDDEIDDDDDDDAFEPAMPPALRRR